MEMAMKLSGKTGMGTKCYYWNGKEVVGTGGNGNQNTVAAHL